jgi:hypothetical protein
MTNSEKYDYFWEQVVPLLMKRLKHVDVCRSGAICYGTFDERVLWATPYWQDADGIDCQWETREGKGLKGDIIPYTVTGNPELDYLNYYMAVENYLAERSRHTD